MGFLAAEGSGSLSWGLHPQGQAAHLLAQPGICLPSSIRTLVGY